jgi:hypothetical protein
MSDGARDALAGYLYQILAAAGIGARAHGGMDDQGQLTCDLVLLARQSRILHEVHQEDVVLQPHEPADGATAVQFKFSRNPRSTPLQPAELRDILHAFDRSRKEGGPALNLTGFVLVTNRPLSRDADSFYQGRDRPTPFAKLKERERKWLISPNTKAREVKQDYGSPQAAAEAWHAIFKRLRIFPKITGQHWLDGLRHYAVERGLPPEEYEGRVSMLVGEAVRGTIQDQLELSQAWLNQALLGFHDARPLALRATGDSAREAARLRAERWYSENLVTKARTVIRRSLMDDVAQQAAQFPVVFLVGDGGCGKSVLAARFVCETASSRLADSTSARDFHKRWLGEAFNHWRSEMHADDLPYLPAKDVLERVRKANDAEERPLIIVNVDGLDEAPDEEKRRELQELLYTCRNQQPPSPFALVLLITARLRDRSLERTRDRLIKNLTSTHHPGELAHQFGFVLVGDFKDEELQLAIAELPSPVRGRLEKAIQVLSGRASSTATLEDEVDQEPDRPVPDRELLSSLRHPALWGEFLDLDEQTQGRVLDGQREAMHELAGRFLERFFSKVWLRHPALPENDLRQALNRIGRRFPTREQRGRLLQHWLAPASKSGLLRHEEATCLFHEAVSYGMIREDGEECWRWRHGFVGNYLLNQKE